MSTSKCMRFRLGVCCLMWLGLVGSCRADSGKVAQSDDVLTLKGFGTLAYARSDSDSAEYVRDLAQPHGLTRKWSSSIDSLVGLQANLKLDAGTEGVVQVLSRYRYDGSYRPEVSWAFLRHDFSPDVQLRVGRLGTEVYMLSDSRLVGYSNQTLRPPPDYYGPLIFSYFDGLDASVSHAFGAGLLRAKLFAGYSPETSPFVESVTWSQKGSPMTGGHLDYLLGAWQFRIGHTRVRFANEQPLEQVPAINFDIISVVPELSVKDRSVSFDSLGVVYDRGPLQVQAMLSRIKYQTASYEDSRASYVIASYRLQQLTPYIGYSQIKSFAKTVTKTLSPIDDIVAGLLAVSHADQHTVTLGARWDFRQDLALKLQLDAIRGQANSIFTFRGASPQWNGRMNVVSVALDFTF